MLRPTRGTVAGHVAATVIVVGGLVIGKPVSRATSEAQPAMAKQLAIMSLQGPCPLSLSCAQFEQSGICAIIAACSFAIAAHGLEAKATPCPPKPRMTASKKKW